MNTITTDIVARLWNLCNILKDDGVTYHQYVTELTYLLFLKMAKETGAEDQIPDGHHWDDLEVIPAPTRLDAYRLTLIHLGRHGSRLVQEIFANASSFIKKPATLSTSTVFASLTRSTPLCMNSFCGFDTRTLAPEGAEPWTLARAFEKCSCWRNVRSPRRSSSRFSPACGP